MQKQKTALIWFNNNLRTQDNVVLQNAIKCADRTIAIYCISPALFEANQFGFKKMEVFRAKFLIESLKDLKQNLQNLNISLLVFLEEAEHCIPRVINKYQISDLFFETEWTYEECHRIKLVQQQLPDEINYHHCYDQFLFHPEDLPFAPEHTPKVFTHFRKILEKKATIRPISKTDTQDQSGLLEEACKIPTLEDLGFSEFEVSPHTAFPFLGGSSHAINRLNHYIFESKSIGVYKKTRNGLIGSDYSSKFSAWLANGSISARQIYWAIKSFEENEFKNQSTYWLIFELIWRDFFKYVALKHGNAIFKINGILDQHYSWKTEKQLVKQWINGTTSNDFINANMIELKTTGWMSNRGRQNVASFFAKTQNLDWRIGASYFESMLIDYDVHSNYGNWMYVSGVGNDPRDRVFNIDLQAKHYDPDRKFRKLWLQTKLF